MVKLSSSRNGQEARSCMRTMSFSFAVLVLALLWETSAAASQRWRTGTAVDLSSGELIYRAFHRETLADGHVVLNGSQACETITLVTQDDDDNDVFTDEETCRDLGLEVGKVYEVALFHAERAPGGRNSNLTLRGFLKNESVCETS